MAIHLQWGLQPPEDIKAAWGARAIHTKRGFDLLFDRQSAEGSPSQDLVRWLNTKGLDAMRERARSMSGAKDELVEMTSECGRFRMDANTNGSYGYVYLVAWEIGN